MIFVINSNSNTCRIYQFSKKPLQLSLLKELRHAASKLKDSDIVSDKQGRYKTDMSARSAYSPHTDPKEAEIEFFAREIAKELNHARTTNALKELIVISPPHMNGILNAQFDKNLHELISKNFTKDLIHLQERELLEFLKEHTQFPGD